MTPATPVESEDRRMALARLADEIIITATEGGIGYWSKLKGRTVTPGPDDLSVFSSFSIEPIDLDEGWGDPENLPRSLLICTAGAIINAISRIAFDVTALPNRPDLRTQCVIAITNPNKEHDFDAGDADCIVQIALFGEVVYG